LKLGEESSLALLVPLVEVLDRLLEELPPRTPFGALLVVVLLGVVAGVEGAAAGALLVVVVSLGTVGDEVACLATLEAPLLVAIPLHHAPVVHTPDAVVEETKVVVTQGLQLLLFD